METRSKSCRRSRPRSLYIGQLAFALAMCCGGPFARADSITITGDLSSDGSAIGLSDPVITDTSTINPGDPFTIVLTYDPASFDQTGSSYVLTDASLTLSFDGYAFLYSSSAGSYIEFSTPGVYGPETASFLVCSSLDNCFAEDFLDLYLTGTITDLSSLASEAGRLAGDTAASPSEFEFLRRLSRLQPNRSSGNRDGGIIYYVHGPRTIPDGAVPRRTPVSWDGPVV